MPCRDRLFLVALMDLVAAESALLRCARRGTRHRQDGSDYADASSAKYTASSTPTCRPVNGHHLASWAWAGWRTGLRQPALTGPDRRRRRFVPNWSQHRLSSRLRRNLVPAHRRRRTAPNRWRSACRKRRPVVRAGAVRLLWAMYPFIWVLKASANMVLVWRACPARGP